jgi:hypothetical protein
MTPARRMGSARVSKVSEVSLIAPLGRLIIRFWFFSEKVTSNMSDNFVIKQPASNRFRECLVRHVRIADQGIHPANPKAVGRHFLPQSILKRKEGQRGRWPLVWIANETSCSVGWRPALGGHVLPASISRRYRFDYLRQNRARRRIARGCGIHAPGVPTAPNSRNRDRP